MQTVSNAFVRLIIVEILNGYKNLQLIGNKNIARCFQDNLHAISFCDEINSAQKLHV